MLKEVTAIGKDIEEARANARAALDVGELDDVQYEVLHAGSKGIFGLIGVKPAKVRAYIELPDKEERRPRPERPRRQDGERRGENRPQKNRPEKKNGGSQKPKRDPKPDITPDMIDTTPKPAVIPEAQLHFEKMEVKEGEDMSLEFIRKVIADLGLDAVAELYSCDDGTRRITVEGADASALIGHHGDTLDALQYLANLASAQKNINGEKIKSRVTLDIEGYRAKREETLRALARRMAAKALRNKRSVMLEPMTAYERRIIHSEIQGIEGVSTASKGEDTGRRIVIFLTDKKPKELFDEEEKTTKKTPLSEEFAPDAEETVTEVSSDRVDESAPVEVIAEATAVEKICFTDDPAEKADAVDENKEPADASDDSQ